MECSDAEILLLQGLAGHIPRRRPIPPQKLRAALNKIGEQISVMPYPAYVINHKYEFIIVNHATDQLLRPTGTTVKALLQAEANIFRIIFDSRLNFRQHLANLDQIEYEQVLRFKGFNLYRQHEDFYQEYPKCMASKLTPNDYDHFCKRWDEIEAHLYDTGPIQSRVMMRSGDVSMCFELKSIPIWFLRDEYILVVYDPMPERVGEQGPQKYHSPGFYRSAHHWLSV